MKKNEKGITLIALVITIIVLLILVTISLSETIGENGILTKTLYARQETLHANVKSKIYLAYSDYRIEKHSKKINITFIQFLQNKGYVTEPASDTVLTTATISPSLVEGMSDHGTFTISMVNANMLTGHDIDFSEDMFEGLSNIRYANIINQHDSMLLLVSPTFIPAIVVQHNITSMSSNDKYTLVCNSKDHDPVVIWTNIDDNGSSSNTVNEQNAL